MKKIVIILCVVVLVALGGITLFVWKPWSRELLIGRGNSAGNIANIGKVVQYKEWHYFADPNGNGIYQIHANDIEDRHMYSGEEATYINVLGDWFYYSSYAGGVIGISKMRADGRKSELICDDFALFLTLSDGWLYYIEYEERHIYRIRIDGTGREQLSDIGARKLNLTDGWLYYTSNEQQNIYKMKIDGTEQAMIYEGSVTELNIDGDRIYYRPDAEDPHIYKMKTDGTGIEQVGDDEVGIINVSDGWIYYSNSEEHYSIYKIRTDGTDRELLLSLTSDTESGPILVLDDWIYYQERDGYPRTPWYRLRTDGTGHELVYGVNK